VLVVGRLSGRRGNLLTVLVLVVVVVGLPDEESNRTRRRGNTLGTGQMEDELGTDRNLPSER
jgi:hypothetical protein